jgi:GTP cyclohydrolase II
VKENREFDDPIQVRREAGMSESIAQSLAADPAVLHSVERAAGELRRGRPVRLENASGDAALVLAAEGAPEARVTELTALAGTACQLAVTARRAESLGLAPPSGAEVVVLDLAGLPGGSVSGLADPTRAPRLSERISEANLVESPPLAAAAVDLVKLARLLPAAIMAPLTSGSAAQGEGLAPAASVLRVTEEEIAEYRFAAARTLDRIADAHVPLLGAEDARVVAFRPADGGHEHLAIIIGEPAADAPTLVRVHSECFTGDLLGSLRCDCGDQLRGAIDAISKAGAGILLYLAQEGRGIGLVNKLRAYTLQDRGADTLEANEQLGFDADERVYLPAAEMLGQLGITRVRLLTNNPAKVQALAHCGITVEERVPHSFPSNAHNEAYLKAKASKLGHLF